MSAHAVFRGVSPAFFPALQQWLDSNRSGNHAEPKGTGVELSTDEETLKTLLHSVKRAVQATSRRGGLEEFHIAVFALDDDRCEMINGRLAREESRLHEALPAMGATPQSLAAARRRARTAVAAGV